MGAMREIGKCVIAWLKPFLRYRTRSFSLKWGWRCPTAAPCTEVPYCREADPRVTLRLPCLPSMFTSFPYSPRRSRTLTLLPLPFTLFPSPPLPFRSTGGAVSPSASSCAPPPPTCATSPTARATEPTACRWPPRSPPTPPS